MRSTKFLFLISLSILGFSLWGQTPSDNEGQRQKLLKQFMQERKQMMKQMIDMFQDDFSSDSFFNDDFDPFKKMGGHQLSQGRNVSITEDFQENGDIHIKVTPKNKNIKFPN